MSVLYKYLSQQADYQKLAENNPPPDAAVDFLGQLILLHHIPFHYLVPGGQMLPAESIRFFSIDTNWLNALLDGAFSIGRAAEVDKKQDADTWPVVASEVIKYANNLRNHLLQQTSSPDDTLPVVSGFLLQSQVVVDYPHLEVRAYTDTGQSQLAPILRFDKLDKTLLLGLFKGNIQEIIFQQPSEGIHFGFDIGAPDTYDKNLRYLSGEEAGKYNGQALKNIPYRPGKRNTLAVAQLANQIASQLTVTPVTEFTSAEYALEMVQSAGEVNIVNQS